MVVWDALAWAVATAVTIDRPRRDEPKFCPKVAMLNSLFDYAASSSGREVDNSCINIRASAAGVAPLSGELMTPLHDLMVKMSSRTDHDALPNSL